MAKTKKKKKPIPHTDGDFTIQGCDQSLRCPGFALLQYKEETRSVEQIKKGSLPNINWANMRKPSGRILCEIAEYMGKFLVMSPTLIVRERSFSKYNTATHIVNKVVGMSDMVLWSALQKSFYEITATEVKKWVAGNGKAEKERVAKALTQYIGEQEYSTNDESDACAVAIGFQLREGYMDLPEENKADEE